MDLLGGLSLLGLRRKMSTFGLDIGSSAVKTVELASRNGGAVVLRSCASVHLPRRAIIDGAIQDTGAVADAIRQCVRDAGVTSRAAVISISGRETITKRVPLPRVSRRELADAIMFEAEHHIPFAVDEVFVDYQVVGKSVDAMDVLLVAVKRPKVLEYMAAVEAAGLEVAVVDLDAFAMQNQFELGARGTGGEAVALVDIGATLTKTNVVRDGVPIFVRDVPFGGNQYTEAIADRLGVSFEEAESAKQGEHIGRRGEDMIPTLESVSRELSLEIQRTFDYLASSTESERIGRVVLSGGCARLTGLDDFLSSSWGIPVEHARPFQAIQVEEARLGADEVEKLGSILAVAVGLSLRMPRDKPT
jgi:type IV pilus assembly protein PilM